jgi:hypothetical protein
MYRSAHNNLHKLSAAVFNGLQFIEVKVNVDR